MNESIDYGDEELTPLIEGDDNFRFDSGDSFDKKEGFREASSVDELNEEIFNVFEDDEQPLELSDDDVDLDSDDDLL